MQFLLEEWRGVIHPAIKLFFQKQKNIKVCHFY